MDKGSLVALFILVTFLLLCADNLLETEQVMNVLLLSARERDPSGSDSSPLDLSDCSFEFSFQNTSWISITFCSQLAEKDYHMFHWWKSRFSSWQFNDDDKMQAPLKSSTTVHLYIHQQLTMTSVLKQYTIDVQPDQALYVNTSKKNQAPRAFNH